MRRCWPPCRRPGGRAERKAARHRAPALRERCRSTARAARFNNCDQASRRIRRAAIVTRKPWNRQAPPCAAQTRSIATVGARRRARPQGDGPGYSPGPPRYMTAWLATRSVFLFQIDHPGLIVAAVAVGDAAVFQPRRQALFGQQRRTDAHHQPVAVERALRSAIERGTGEVGVAQDRIATALEIRACRI
ncbi:hypothetical protein XMIN_287 [Xanthomonas citri pv. mangiferaeindicae LMG 941]|nr:hypothetical protein XMIN_287 [Xanthomonas citri pv. mangiferaeindicae LMG 941]